MPWPNCICAASRPLHARDARRQSSRHTPPQPRHRSAVPLPPMPGPPEKPPVHLALPVFARLGAEACQSQQAPGSEQGACGPLGALAGVYRGGLQGSTTRQKAWQGPRLAKGDLHVAVELAGPRTRQAVPQQQRVARPRVRLGCLRDEKEEEKRRRRVREEEKTVLNACRSTAPLPCGCACQHKPTACKIQMTAVAHAMRMAA